MCDSECIVRETLKLESDGLRWSTFLKLVTALMSGEPLTSSIRALGASAESWGDRIEKNKIDVNSEALVTSGRHSDLLCTRHACDPSTHYHVAPPS